MTLALNRPHGLLLVNGSVYDLGKGEPAGSMEKSGGAQDAGVGLDGNFYLPLALPAGQGPAAGLRQAPGPDLRLRALRPGRGE